MYTSLTTLEPNIVPNSNADQTNLIKAALQAASLRKMAVYIPAGTYKISDTIVNITDRKNQSLGLKGEGINRTRIICTSDLNYDDRFIPSNTAQKAIIQLHGKTAFASPYEQAQFFACEDIELSGGKNAVNFVDARFASHSYWTRCLFTASSHSALIGYQFWDSCFRDCRWNGITGTNKPVVNLLGPITTENSWCNNCIFENCDFEACKGTAISFGPRSTKNYINNCKFDRIDGDAVVIDDVWYACVTRSQFVGVEGTCVKITNPKSVDVSNNVFGHGNIGIDVTADSKAEIIITPNIFGIHAPMQQNQRINIS